MASMDALVHTIWWPSYAVVSTLDSLVSHAIALFLQTLVLARDLLAKDLDVLPCFCERLTQG